MENEPTVTRKQLVHVLSHAVQCKYPNGAFFETIAAFDCETAAKHYLMECAEGASKIKMNFEYRIAKVVTR